MMFGFKAKALLVSLVVSILLIGKADSMEMQARQNLVIDDLKYGCIYENTNFKTKLKPDPNWSTLIGVEDLHLSEDWIDFKNHIARAFADVIGNYSLNDVDQFIRFIQAYNHTGNKKSLESFFKDYEVPFQPLEDPVSFLGEINRRLVDSYPRAKNKMYIISAYVNPPESNVRDVKEAHDTHLKEPFTVVEELTNDKFQRHVAGVIKVTIGSTKERGIVLLDPGYMNGDERVNPYFVLLMENATSEEHKVHLNGNGLGDIKFRMGRMFVLASGKLTRQSEGNVLYYRDKVFCSFMESTTKSNLLAPNHGIMTFDPRGAPKGYLTFKVVPESTSIWNKSPFFKIVTFQKATGPFKALTVTFESLRTANTNISSKNAIVSATEYFKLKEGDNLLSKLQTIQSQVFENPALVTEIYELTNKFNPKKNAKIRNLLGKNDQRG